MNHKHIVQIVIKNTSTLDFTIPLFWKIKQEYPECKISILYCVFDKKEILRDSKFFSNFCKKYDIKEYDFSDFLKNSITLLKKFFKTIFLKSKADKLSFYEIKENLKRFNLKVLPEIFKLILTRIEKSILKNSIDYDIILPKLSPDIILFDNRSVSNFAGRDKIYNFIYNAKLPIYLIPHAPHMRDAISEFCSFDEKGEELPSFCRFMIPFKYGTPWVGREDKKEQFFVSGYPGFDSDWLEYCKRDKENSETINVLFIIRRFLQQGIKREPDTDPFIIDYDDFIEPLKLIKEAINKSNENINLIIKPHPSNNYNELAKVMEQTGIKSWEISHEPMYELLNKIDIVCSLASTVLLIPAIANIPTIIFDTKLQRQIHKRWDKLEELYTKMNYCLNDNSNFIEKFSYIVDNLSLQYEDKIIRELFDDNSSITIINKIKEEV